jgi:hypothetical protein
MRTQRGGFHCWAAGHYCTKRLPTKSSSKCPTFDKALRCGVCQAYQSSASVCLTIVFLAESACLLLPGRLHLINPKLQHCETAVSYAYVVRLLRRTHKRIELFAKQMQASREKTKLVGMSCPLTRLYR